MNTSDKPAVQTLENATQAIVDEMFQNGPEEGCRIWEDASHPLHRAIVILMQARCQLPSTIKEAAAFLEQHRRMEEVEATMSDDFETVVKLNEKDIEIIGNMFAQYFVRCNSEPEPVDCSRQSALLRKILDTRTAQIIEARASGKL